MKQSEEPLISLIVATRNRARSLRNLLASLDRLHPPPVAYEVIVVDNGSEDETRNLLQQWAQNHHGYRVLRETQPGKSRAMNTGIRQSRGKWLAFVDDDVVVEPDYLVQVWEFCRTSCCAAAQGTVLWPPDAETNLRLKKLLRQYPDMIPHVARPEGWEPITLVGANMLVRRDTFEAVGLFDERLGGGASGFAEDDEMADRIRQAGGRIGYMANVRVTHEIDPNRLTTRAFLERARKIGHSDAIRNPRPVVTWLLPRMGITGLRLILATACGTRAHRLRALGRWHRYWAMLKILRKGTTE